MATDRPLTFEIPIADFDLGLLPATARTIGSHAFEEAVLTYFMRQYAGKGINAGVAMDNRVIRVTLFPEHSRSLLDHAVALMREGKLDEGAEILAWMRENAEPGVGVLYNLGIAHSERGRFHAAIEALKACSAIDANYVDAWTGLGVAYQHLSQSSQAEQALRCAAPRHRARPGQWICASQSWCGAIGKQATSRRRGASSAGRAPASKRSRRVVWPHAGAA